MEANAHRTASDARLSEAKWPSGRCPPSQYHVRAPYFRNFHRFFLILRAGLRLPAEPQRQAKDDSSPQFFCLSAFAFPFACTAILPHPSLTQHFSPLPYLSEPVPCTQRSGTPLTTTTLSVVRAFASRRLCASPRLGGRVLAPCLRAIIRAMTIRSRDWSPRIT